MRWTRGGAVAFSVSAIVGVAVAQAAPPATVPATVHLIGVQHAPGELLHAAMSPAHVRCAIAAIAPDAIGVETCPEWFANGHFYRETYEAEVVAVPWARANGRAVHAIDWIGDDSTWAERQRLARVERERADLGAADLDAKRFGYGAVAAAQLREVAPDAECDFVKLNGEAFAAMWNEWLDAKRTEAGSPQEYIARRNAHIADAIAAAARAHPGGKLAVVIGAAHCGDLVRLLPARGIAVATAPAVTALRVSDDDLAPADLVAILAHATDNGDGIAPPAARLASLRERLREQTREAHDAREARDAAASALRVLAAYVDARAAMLAGDAAAAARAFAPLVETGANVRFPYRGSEWRLHLTVGQAARLELGRLADLAGRRADARAHYEALLATLPAPALDRSYHAEFEFAARARNAVRALLQTPFVAELAVARGEPVAVEAAAAGNAVANAAAKEMQHTWELHRAGKWQELRTAVAAIDGATLGTNDRLEVDFHLAAASVALGERADAVARLDALDERARSLGVDHWLVRELPALRRRLP